MLNSVNPEVVACGPSRIHSSMLNSVNPKVVGLRPIAHDFCQAMLSTFPMVYLFCEIGGSLKVHLQNLVHFLLLFFVTVQMDEQIVNLSKVTHYKEIYGLIVLVK